jgi:hypothetical protein
MIRAIAAAAFALTLTSTSPAMSQTGPVPDLPYTVAEHLGGLALACVHQEYPNKIAHVLQGPQDARTPSQLTPAFFGCYDWHSAVHGHWLLARLAAQFPDTPLAAAAHAALARSITPETMAAEVAYMTGPGRASFERPYGLAWLLALQGQLVQGVDDDLARTMKPLVDVAVARLTDWLPKLRYPVRVGEHSQTAFALGLIHDYAMSVGADAAHHRPELLALVEERALTYFASDRNCPLSYEPDGEAFLSPCIAEADLMRRVMSGPDFSRWLETFLPQIPRDGSADWLPVAVVSDRTDGKLVHLDGLNLSRAWMLEGIASALPERDRRRAALLAAARAHSAASLPFVSSENYEGGHWLGTFATYLVTRAGIRR